VTLENGIPVPANAEYAMTAEITLEDDVEAPYVDITGTIDDERMEPVFEIHSLHHRNNPIYHALIPAEAEHKALMGLPRAPTIKSAVSKVTTCHDVHMTEGGCGWLSAVVSITPNSADDGRKSITAALNGHKSMKSVTIVNKDIDVGSPVRVEWALMTRWQPDQDTIILSGQKGSSLDPSRNEDGTTSKIGYDATLPPEIDPAPYTSVQ
ncbi:MAG: UbiD family decarboxylase, partial [Candidatus Thalassarchaeaceae archaeon]|nr:UbiD family decarboxylase [Candidatus Thalassarchaeaceae archaeon]